MKRRIKIVIFVLFVIAFIFPVVLNSLLLWDLKLSIVGDASTWLVFWGSYISGALSLIIIYLTYNSLQFAFDQAKNEKKSKLHGELRSAFLQVSSAIDLVEIKSFSQDILDGDVIATYNTIYKKQSDFNRAIHNLEYILKDRDGIYEVEEAGTIITKLNNLLKPFIDYFEITFQFITMKKGIKLGSYGNLNYSEIFKLQENPLKDLISNCQPANSIVNKNVSDRLVIIFDEMMEMKEELDKLFSHIYTLDNNR